MIEWSCKLRTPQIATLRRVAEAEIEGKPFSSNCGEYHTQFMSLRRQRLVEVVQLPKVRRHVKVGSPDVKEDDRQTSYRLTDLGVAILKLIDDEIEQIS